MASASEYIASKITRSAPRKNSTKRSVSPDPLVLESVARRHPAGTLETVTVRIAGMPLAQRRHRHVRDVVTHARHQVDELEGGTKRREADRKRRGVHLSAQRGLELRVAAVDTEAIAGDVRGDEERQPHDVIPMQMGKEDVVGPRRSRAMPRENRLPERTHAATQIAQDVVASAGLEFDARGVAAERSRYGKAEPVDVRFDGVIRSQWASPCAAHGRDDARAEFRGGKRHRKRPARAPETDAFHDGGRLLLASYAASAAGEMAASASRTVAKTSTTVPNRLIAMISATTGCNVATPMRALRAHRPSSDHQHAQPDAADIAHTGEIEHEAGTEPRRGRAAGRRRARAPPRWRDRCGPSALPRRHPRTRGS